MLSVVVSFFLLTGSKTFAQVYIYIEGVNGESKSTAFPSSTQISSFQWGASNTAAASSTGAARANAGKVQMSGITITKQRGSASSALQMFVFNGKRIPKAELRFYKPGTSTEYLIIKLEDVLISSWSMSSDGEAPTETFSLNFTKFTTEDATTGAGGKLERGKPVGWDLSKNTAY